jgi:hypothetical protein
MPPPFGSKSPGSHRLRRLVLHLAQRNYRPSSRCSELAPLSAAAAADGCGSGGGGLCQLKARASHVDPSAREYPAIGYVFDSVDADSEPADMQHAAVDTRVPSRGQLVIWLSNPASTRHELFERLASYGCHAIKVHYANHWFGRLPPEVRGDGVSLGQIRLEAATGTHCGSDFLALREPDGMMGRALRFVRWLADAHPAGRWGQFLSADGTALRWAECVTVAGSSHGSTTAARFATHQECARCVLFCGPNARGAEIGDTASGFSSATPSDRIFAFGHVEDSTWPECEYPGTPRSWKLLGLKRHGGLVSVDGATPPPYNGSRMLVSSADVGGGTDTREMVAHCTVVPGHREIRGTAGFDSQGKYIYEDCWKYLFTHPVSANTTSKLANAD